MNDSIGFSVLLGKHLRIVAARVELAVPHVISNHGMQAMTRSTDQPAMLVNAPTAAAAPALSSDACFQACRLHKDLLTFNPSLVHVGFLQDSIALDSPFGSFE